MMERWTRLHPAIKLAVVAAAYVLIILTLTLLKGSPS